MENSNFFASSKEIVSRFLNNVIAVDDQLSFGKAITTIDSSVNDDFAEFDAASNDVSGLGVVPQTPLIPAPMDNPLNYQDLSIAFSDKGINCCAFKPDPSRDVNIPNASNRIMTGSKHTDITILDWQMDSQFKNNQDSQERDGTLAIASIAKILQHDKEQQGRLRLIVIYTGSPELTGITKVVSDHLNSKGYSNTFESTKSTFNDDVFKFCHIEVIEKMVDAAQLVDRVITLFTKLTIGLLSNATLSAIGELREKTHHILHTFNKQLDPAYLSHVVGLFSSPQVREKAHEVAFDYATDIISEEIKSNLQISQSITNNLNLTRIHDWVDYINSENRDDLFQVKINDGNNISITSDRIKRLLSTESEDTLLNTLSEAPVIMKRNGETIEKFKKAKIQISLNGVEYLPHENLSAIECKRRDLKSLTDSSPLPTIKQGSIVKKSDTEFYMCMQPLCDSVRIQSPTNFIFIKIDRMTAANPKFTHVLRSADDTFMKFKIKPGSKDIHIFKLIPDITTSSIKVIRRDNRLVVCYIKDDEQQAELSWIGEFKNSVAQSIANSLASNISRVGLDTNEWLRLSC
ncbi:response regulator receiver domain [Klebsiella michiganensis]|uniref:response regulator receiver domain n=1 Tax=Klebsiella michiganensis TaxID=1134687 RepID=UPI000B2073DF|nr:response regulator receiver domain [Klebsiella michiganensis]